MHWHNILLPKSRQGLVTFRQKSREKVRVWYFLSKSSCHNGILLLDQFGSSKPGPNVGDLYLAALANFATFYKDYKSLHSGNAVALSADFRDLHVVFLTGFYWLGAAVAEAIASSATVTSFAV
jgi:hypothetical protein